MNSIKITILGLCAILFSCSKSNNNCEAIAKPDCFYTQEYAPVCGCDGVIYSNAGHAACNSIEDFKVGPCSTLGEYRFLGFSTDGAKVGLNEQKYTGDPMTITLEEDADNDLLSPFNGKGQPNSFGGKYHVEGKEYSVEFSTEALGSNIEYQFVQWLPRVISTKKNGDYLIMETNSDITMSMIFIRK